MTPNRPEIPKYHRSLTTELLAVKDRVRSLVRYDNPRHRSHWLTDGEWKEAVLRSVLRRHMPESVVVGRGFIVGREFSSTQIDLLVLRPLKPTLFRDGDLVVVTPDAAGAVVQVKTKLDGNAAWHKAAMDLARISQRCREISKNDLWTGIFAYEGDLDQGQHILDAVCKVHRETGVAINCVACGRHLFMRFWPIGEYEPGDVANDLQRAFWRTYRLRNLAPAYLVGNLIDSICDVERAETDYAFFAYREGKRGYRLDERRVEECS
jgi:hypothetical protein